jgi:epsilon-lactone hydrolase
MASEQLTMVVNMLRSGALGVSPESPIEQLRAGMESMAGMFTVPADVTCERVDAGGVPAEWIVAPEARRARVILYLHGGGYVMGSIKTHRALAVDLSRAAAARVLLIDYRLAPEHPFPAAVDDATAAYRWLLAHGVQPARLAIAGDSAGGGLTVATLVALRDAGTAMPAAGVCLSPWVDLEGIGESMTSKAAVDPMVQRDGLKRMASFYLGGHDPRTPLAAPLYADLSGLPPLLIQVGTAETLRDDSTRLAERARKAGVAVELEEWEDMIHVFQAFAMLLPEGRQAIEKIGAFVRERTGP